MTFSALVTQIAETHDELGHELGWRFLYSPESTLASDARLAFVGLNPGGSMYEEPSASVEAGNAYRVEPWGPNGRLTKLQSQIGLLYEAIAASPESRGVAALMDTTLAANFCPFRSPSWASLKAPRESVEFSQRLWLGILKETDLHVVICLGDVANKQLRDVLSRSGARVGTEAKTGVGWGNKTYGVTHVDRGQSRLALIRLPHLSRFGFLGREPAREATEALADTIREGLE